MVKHEICWNFDDMKHFSHFLMEDTSRNEQLQLYVRVNFNWFWVWRNSYQ